MPQSKVMDRSIGLAATAFCVLMMDRHVVRLIGDVLSQLSR